MDYSFHVAVTWWSDEVAEEMEVLVKEKGNASAVGILLMMKTMTMMMLMLLITIMPDDYTMTVTKRMTIVMLVQ